MEPNLAVFMALWQRPQLTSRVIAYYRRLCSRLLVVVAGSEGEQSERLARNSGAHVYVEAPNVPLGRKINDGMQAIRQADVDGVIVVGSDDLVSSKLLGSLAHGICAGKAVQGLLDAYFHDVATGDTIWWHGYEGGRRGETIGAGRCLSRTALDALQWRPWDDTRNRSMDGAMMARLRARGIGVHAGTMATMGELVCMKGEGALNPLRKFRGTKAMLPLRYGERVSVVIPACDQPSWVCDAVESALHQSYLPNEIIVVDGSSTDVTTSVLARYAQNPWVRVLRRPWHGLADALNEGIRVSTGHWFVPLAAGDELAPQFIEETFEAAAAAAAVFTGTQMLGPQDSVHGPEPWPCARIHEQNPRPATALFSRNAYDELGGFDPDDGVSYDRGYWLRLAAAGKTVRRVDKPLLRRRVRCGQASGLALSH